jgi:glycosyltransferase involved in cell wall biosynthesis
MPSRSGSKLKVLHIVDTLGMGGAETWLMELLRFWHRQGENRPQIDFLATSGNTGIFDDEATALGARIFYLRYGRSNVVSFGRGLRQILKRGEYSVIHDHQGYASGWHFVMGAGLLPRVRVTHIHSALRRFEAKRFAGQLGKSLVGRYATRIVGTSRQVITEYGFDSPSFAHIPRMALYCGFDSWRFIGDRLAAKASFCRELGWPEDAKIILFVGRIDASADLVHPRNQKNSGFAVSVGIECARRDASVRMVLAGERSFAVPILEQRIAAAGLEGHIQFVGIRKDIERLMLGSDVLLFPSRGEGLGMVAVEAQAAGLPVLASTKVPVECVVVPELVRFKEVEEGEAAWADELLQLAGQPRDILGANQRVAASAFAIEHSAQAVVRLYRSRRNVLHVVDTLGMGGAETWLMEVLRVWHREGENWPQIDFLATSGKPGVFDDEATALGARIFYLRYGRSNFISFRRGLRQILKRGEYSVIHDHQAYVSGWHFAIGAGLLPRVRVTHIHNPAYQVQNGTPWNQLSARVGRNLVDVHSTHIIGTSRQVITEYGFDSPSFAHIPRMALYCGFDSSRFIGDRLAAKASFCRELGWPEDAKIILFAGRIDQSPDLGHPRNHKNSGFAVSVGIECARRDADVRMVFAGERSFAVPILEQRIAAAGLEGHIQFVGIRKDIERLMLGSDVLLFPSRGDELLQLAGQPRDILGANQRVAASAFAIENSSSALLRLYGEGALS